MQTIHAIFENGVFRPKERVDLPERCEVVFQPQIITPQPADALDEVYAILSERYTSGHDDTAVRHDEHQP